MIFKSAETMMQLFSPFSPTALKQETFKTSARQSHIQCGYLLYPLMLSIPYNAFI